MQNRLFIICFIFLLCSCGFDCDEFLKKEISPLEFSGVIIEKKESEIGCFGELVIKSNGKIDTLKNIYSCEYTKPNLWEEGKVGALIEKDSGSLLFFITKDGVKKTVEFPCVKH